jgi:hypothetical protein
MREDPYLKDPVPGQDDINRRILIIQLVKSQSEENKGTKPN